MNKKIENCDGCGACCLEQHSPPGYTWFLLRGGPGEDVQNQDIHDDWHRFKNLPSVLVDELRTYAKLPAYVQFEDEACIWYDKQTKRCKHHEHRPSICRNFELDSDDCHDWRELYQIS